MIPSITATAFIGLNETAEQSSRTFGMNVSDEVIRGHTDELEAMKQAVFKILQTERYQNLIYSENYGTELADLFGQPMSYVQPELERRITEALLQDERILSVGDFEFSNKRKGELLATFKVKTVFGDFSGERSVNY